VIAAEIILNLLVFNILFWRKAGELTRITVHLSVVPTPPQAIIIAGPNGSGKSTAATVLLSSTMTFINADMIAQEISGVRGTSADINAGRILLDRLEALESDRNDFAFETTLATKMLHTRVKNWNDDGYQVHLVFFWLPSPDMCVLRVQGRVADGGHHVPESTIRRRYHSGLKLFFNVYRHLVATWRLYDNSQASDPKIIARGREDGSVKIHQPEIWNKLISEYGGEVNKS
jgi:predicted ABC-type ATPase